MKNLFKILFATLAVIFALNACDDGGRIIDEIDDLTSLTLKDVDIVDNLPLTLQYAQIVDPTITSTKYKIAADLLATSSTQSLAQLASKHGVSLSQLSEIALKDIEIECPSRLNVREVLKSLQLQRRSLLHRLSSSRSLRVSLKALSQVGFLEIMSSRFLVSGNQA